MTKTEEIGQLTSSEELKEIFHGSFSQELIENEIVHAFGYGSGVFSQEQTLDGGNVDDADNDASKEHNHLQHSSEKKDRKMLDMILIVNDATNFHSLNQQLNPDHYAPFFRASPTRAAWWQQGSVLPPSMFGINPGVFFNFVDDAKCWMKYGIMTRDDLVSDLMNWDSLYLGGRLHKPTATIYISPKDNSNNTEDDEGTTNILRLQQKYNLPAAVSLALLIASATKSSDMNDDSTAVSLSLPELYSHISGLSYTGDFRIQMGAEDPRKINKLVHSPGQLARFHSLYYESAILPLVERNVISSSTPASAPLPPSSFDTLCLTWNPRDPLVLKQLWKQLPKRFQRLPQSPTWVSDGNSSKIHAKHSVNSMDLQKLQKILTKELHAIVAPAARYQSFKGLWTAGIGKSATYAFAKLSKGILRRR